MMNKKKINKHKIFIVFISLVVIGLGSILSLDLYVRKTVTEKILTPEEADELESVDCIIVLGCYVKENGLPSDH